MTGCLEKASDLSSVSSLQLEDQAANPRLQMDFDAELRSDLFSVRGDLMLPGNSTLAYLYSMPPSGRERKSNLAPNTC